MEYGQRGLPLISPTILTKRLNDLADAEIILKKENRWPTRL